MTQSTVTAIGGDTREERVSIAGIKYVLRPIAVGLVPLFLREGGAAIAALLGSDDESPDWLALIEQHGEALVRAVSIATGIRFETVQALDVPAFIELASLTLRLNMDFFIQRARPAIGRLVSSLALIAQQASSRNSTATPQP